MGQESGVNRLTADHPIERVGSPNRSRTDALGALATWRDKAPSRDFKVLQG
jgi:hypothetical protein